MPSLPDLLAAAKEEPWLVAPDDVRALAILLEAHAAVAEAARHYLAVEFPSGTSHPADYLAYELEEALARLAEAEKEQGA